MPFHFDGKFAVSETTFPAIAPLSMHEQYILGKFRGKYLPVCSKESLLANFIESKLLSCSNFAFIVRFVYVDRAMYVRYMVENKRGGRGRREIDSVHVSTWRARFIVYRKNVV